MFEELDSPKKDPDVLVSVVDVMGWAEEAQQKWMKDNTKESIEKEVYDTLEKRKSEVVAKLLGFDPHWGKWELDHCNGRSGNSDAGMYLAQCSKHVVKDWLTAQGHDLENVKLPASLVTSIKKEVLSNAKRQFKRELEILLLTRMQEFAQEVIDEYIKDSPFNVMNELKSKVPIKSENS